ncbi:MAG TPA: glutamate 5-kinase [Pyrinomonadaceae bacterium]|jgi:glutamate 5-kinase|nr:glutamate 5-kinase [Pyrinomonadaceae bacterium]
MEADELQNERQRRFRGARRVVVKLGTSVVTGAGGEVCAEHIEPIVRSLAGLRAEGRGVVLVSSGAVGLGAGRLGLARARLSDVVVRQACAAVGQSLLMHAYEKLFRAYDVKIAQVLLTEDDFTDRRRYSNLRRTMEKLLKLGVVPIVNENDTVSTAELEYTGHGAGRVFSDNDRLAALVMSKLESDALVLLSDVDGLLIPKPPGVLSGTSRDESLSVLPYVAEVTPELKSLATGASATGRGGMLTKLEAAEIAMRAGGVAVIANGRRADTLQRVFDGEQVGTAFVPTSRMAGKRRWIAYAAGVRGRVVVNAGAREAILRGKASLLASGVVRVEGEFEPHDVVSIADAEGREFARGIANCASRDVGQLTGQRDEVSAPDAAHRQRAVVLVTRDNIVILEGQTESDGEP